MIGTMKYKSHTFIVPPRAETKVPPDRLESMFESRGWWAQVKKNGQNLVISVAPDKTIKIWDRHGVVPKRWSPTGLDIFKNLPGKGSYVFNTELLDKWNLKDINYIHDILVYNDEYLLGKSYGERCILLSGLFLKKQSLSEEFSHYILDQHTWLVRNITKNFKKVFDSLERIEDEGLVLKNPRGILTVGKPTWTVKCRKEHKNYDF